MEIIIAIFLGAWVAVAGAISYVAISKDFKQVENQNKEV